MVVVSLGVLHTDILSGPTSTGMTRLPRSQKEFRTCFGHIFFSYVTHPENRCVIILGRQRSLVLGSLVVAARVVPEVVVYGWLEDVGGCCTWLLIAIGFPPRRSELLRLRLQPLPTHGQFSKQVTRREMGHKMRYLRFALKFTIDVMVCFCHWRVSDKSNSASLLTTKRGS